jgi:hypothetical protein
MTLSRGPRALLFALAIVAAGLATLSRPSDASPTAPAATARPHDGPAPADEYFGRLQMSILGVRNKVKDLGLEADLHPDHRAAVLASALLLEDAIQDWAKKYPFDRWLPRYAFALEQMYERIPGESAHQRAIRQLGYITTAFPHTVYAKVGRMKLALGVPRPKQTLAPLVVASGLDRLALLDGRVIPTLPPVAMRGSPARPKR